MHKLPTMKPVAATDSALQSCPQVTLAMQRAKAGARGYGVQCAVARVILWLLDDLPAQLEATLFPDAVERQVSFK